MKSAGRFFVLALAFNASSRAWAQDDGFEIGALPLPKAPPPLFTSAVEVGVGYQSLDSFYFGRYGGITGKGPFLIFKADVDGGDAWNKGSRFWDAAVDIKGFDTLSLSARGGVQGHWRLSAFYDSFTRVITDSARTPYEGIGSARLSLPANWVTGVSSAQFSLLTQAAKPVELKVDWKNVGGDFVFIPYDGYEVRIQFDYRNRDGLRPQALPFGQEANFSVGVFFPQPIDYDSHRLNVAFSYAGARLQWSGSYNLSVFNNAHDAVFVPNPYARSLGLPWPGGAFAGYPRAFAQYGLAPDSAAHQFLISGGYTLSPKTRVTMRLSYTLQSQNDPFLPYTPSTSLLVTTPLPRSSLNGKVHKTYAAVNLTSREWDKTDIAVGYTMDDRQNKSPINIYSYVANDAQDQIQPLVPGNSRYIRLNLPHSFTFQQAKAEVGYRIAPRTRLSVSYNGDFRWRDYQQVEETREHTFKAKVHATFAAGSTWLSTSYALRAGSNYNSALPWNLSHTEPYLNAAPSNQSIEQPLLRKYNLADRRRSETKGGVTWDLSRAVSFDVSGGYAADNYHRSLFGLRQSRALSLDTNVTYAFGQRFTSSLFYSFQRIDADQNGYLIFDTTSGNPNRAWSVQNRDTVHTAGFHTSWSVAPDKFKLDASYLISDATGRSVTQATPGIIYSATAPLPAARGITHSATLVGEYAFKPNTALRLGYTIERHISRDWQYDKLGLAPVAQIMGSGILSPRYTAHVVWMTTRYQF